jgi:DNA-binding MarR family transcriptional regulator
MEILKPGCIFKHIVMTSARLEAFANKHFLEVFGLTLPSLKILDVVSRHKAVTPTQLMKELGCTKSNITQRLDVMEKNKFIQRTSLSRSKDKRRVGIGITDLGKEKLAEAVHIISAKGIGFEKMFSPKEIVACHSFLGRINDLLDQYEN